MNPPLVSVIVPTYNRREILHRCISSILRQSYTPVQLIVIDDGSTDGTEEFVRSNFGADVLLVPCVHTGHPGRVRNAGLEVAGGEFIAFCDSDDIWYESKLSVQMDRLLNSDVNFSCSDARLSGADDATLLGHYVFNMPDLHRQLLWDNFIITSSVVLRKSAVGGSGFPTTPELLGYEDYWFWLSLVENLRIDFIREPLLLYSQQPGRLSDRVRARDMNAQLHILLRHPVYRKHPVLMLKKLLRQGRSLAG